MKDKRLKYLLAVGVSLLAYALIFFFMFKHKVDEFHTRLLSEFDERLVCQTNFYGRKTRPLDPSVIDGLRTDRHQYPVGALFDEYGFMIESILPSPVSFDKELQFDRMDLTMTYLRPSDFLSFGIKLRLERTLSLQIIREQTPEGIILDCTAIF